MKNTFTHISFKIAILFYLFLMISSSAFSQDINSMLNNKHKIIVDNNFEYQNNNYIKVITKIKFPKNYFTKNAKIEVKPFITTNIKTYEVDKNERGKFSQGSVTGHTTVEPSGNTTYEFSSYYQLSENEKVQKIDLKFKLDINGVQKEFFLAKIKDNNNPPEIVDIEKDTNSIQKIKVDTILSINTVLLKSDSLNLSLKNNTFNQYSVESELDKIDLSIIKIDTTELLNSNLQLTEFIDKQEKTLTDTLKYLTTVIEIKQVVIKEIKITLEDEISKPKTEQSSALINYLHSLLIQLEREISTIKEEISHTQIKILEQEEAIRQAKNNFIILIISLLFLGIITIIIFILYRKKKKHNNVLKEKNTIISNQNEEITIQNENINEQNTKLEHQQNEILSSINYASRIQSALLPTNEQLDRILKNYFVFYSPRDIVSGDYYWSYEKENIQIIVAADCTGHGVPGAFMSALGISFLNEIIVNKTKINSAEILNSLRIKIKYALKQTGNFKDSQDGMDMSICLINRDKKRNKFCRSK